MSSVVEVSHEFVCEFPTGYLDWPGMTAGESDIIPARNKEAIMENLLNPEVIKAAASSPLGLLSLMCLIIGIVSLGLFRKAPVWAKLVVFVLLLAGVFGFGASVVRQPNPQPEIPEASREFVVGRWQVEQAMGGAEGGTFVDYAADGWFTGKLETFVNGAGRREPVSGAWDLAKLARTNSNWD